MSVMSYPSYKRTVLFLVSRGTGVEILVAMLETEELRAIRTIVMIDSVKLALAGPTKILLLLHLKHLSSVHMLHTTMRLLLPIMLVTKLHHTTPTSLLHLLQR